MAAATRDKMAVPSLAVTGIGVVTSLGIGKSRQLDETDRRRVRHQAHHAVSGRGAAHHHRRREPSMTFIAKRWRPRICPSGSRCSPRKKRSQSPASAAKGHFPGPLYLAPPPLEIEWADRIGMAEMAAAEGVTGYPDLLRVARDYAPRDGRVHSSSASSANTSRSISAPRARRSRSTPPARPARAPSSSAWKRSGAATARQRSPSGPTHRRRPSCWVRFSLLSALSTQNDPPERSKPFSKNRDGFVLAEGAAALVLEDLDHARARGARILGILEGVGEKSHSFHRTRSSPDGKPIVACCATRWPMPASRRRISTTSTPTAPRHPRMTRWNTSDFRRCSAKPSAASRSRPTNR